ncbi:sensor histidine kinase [Nocardia bovistercoris]|uniref:histidine kinase n=1 Tax=Nocardia bovistercoris TaxID=2785916 RepID=A0A931IHA7_9NOCA|nr:histidine kinase [Nocardia bovistercoris]MBH0781376.1 histidine kinase [Nocardia bovistercoris]
MDVTDAIGTRQKVPFRESGTIRERFAAFLRDPVGVVRTNMEELPFDYPPSVMIAADGALVLVVAGATIQRHAYFPSALPLLGILLLFLSIPLFCVFGVAPSPILVAVSGLAATGLFLVQPVFADFAPFILVVVAGEIGAIVAKRWSGLFALLAIVELAALDAVGNLHWNVDGQRLQGLPMYTVGVALGWLVGVMLQYQRKYLYQERESQAIRAAQAADGERGRIAREVHDVIAHSLSVTLLHLTAARHALQTDRDVDDAVEALVDAERLGRQAMADIRRTIGLLDNGGPAKHAPEPGLGDMDDLVADFVRAGLDVRRAISGDPDAVSAAVGLALYRIGQESLANVVKHAPGATVTVRLTVDSDAARLTVSNTMPHGPARNRGTGMGVSGMRQRAELLGGRLGAGPDDDGWSVRAEFPTSPARAAPACAAGLIQGVSAKLRDGIPGVATTAREGM